jgi:polyphosphate kinase
MIDMKKAVETKKIIRDLSWLAFNARVLQEANDSQVPLNERLRFLGIFSNNLDEFFRVRVATLNRMVQFGKTAKIGLEQNPEEILKQISITMIAQQKEFEKIYINILVELKQHKIAIINETQLSIEQIFFIENYFNEKVRTNIYPLMIESIPELPPLNDKSIYLACLLANAKNSMMNSYALIEIPTKVLPRFVILPENKGVKNVILLEDIIRYSLPKLFNQFGFNSFEGYIIKVTKDAELDNDSDFQNDLILRLEKGLKNRKKGKAIRLVYDKSIPKKLLSYLIKLLGLNKNSHIVPGSQIHNFKDFMDFPKEIFDIKTLRQKPFVHPLLKQPIRILEVLNIRDVMLNFPYHSFDSIIDLLREAAIDPFVESIKITCYRLAKESKIVNALINAVRNGKKVVVVIELRARFDEEANLRWKKMMEEEGVVVIVGLPSRKIHAKLCLISKRINKSLKHYGFVSTGNLNETTAKIYGDHCLLTADKRIMSDVIKIFYFIKNQNQLSHLENCKYIITSPYNTRSFFIRKIHELYKHKKQVKTSELILKLNSLSDEKMIDEIYEAKKSGVHVKLIVRGICCVLTEHKKWSTPIEAISIIDEYLEHARVISFTHQNKQALYISSADWMLRNLNHRIEASIPIFNTAIKQELTEILRIQLSENEKARKLNNVQSNDYVLRDSEAKSVRSQVEIYQYLLSKKY